MNIIKKILLLSGIAGLNFSCTNQAGIMERPNIVWITSEDNSKHYLKLFDENGVATPNIEKLAAGGLTYTRAFSNAPVCSAARSTLISGCYGPRLASHYHRKIKKTTLPGPLKMFPAYLREVGYYTSNNNKEDYNFDKPDGVWDESSNKASWRKRGEGQPFFHVQNIGVTHESSLHFSPSEINASLLQTDTASFQVDPKHPATSLIRYTNALYRDKIREMDKQVGEIVEELKKDGLLENTIIFYFADNGGVLPGSKGYLYETGLHVPLVVYIPEKYKSLNHSRRGERVAGFVSFVDFGPTVLNLAGIDVPEEMDGSPFLGRGVGAEEVNSRDEALGYADRFDEKYDMVRSLRKGRYKYMRSYQPFNYDALWNNYRYKQPAYRQYLSLYKEGSLNKVQSAFFEQRPPELLFDLENDPHETRDLSGDPRYAAILEKMRGRMNEMLKGMPDLSFFPEHYLIENAFSDPVAFGNKNKERISEYMEIADLVLLGYEDAKDSIESALKSEDPWKRYWGIVVGEAYGEQAAALVPVMREIARNDKELLNRVRAAEFLGIIEAEDPSEHLAASLYQTKDQAEALMILNSIVLMSDLHFNYLIAIDADRVNRGVRENGEVALRLNYLEHRQPAK